MKIKITNYDKIKELYLSGKTLQQIAIHFQCCVNTVNRILIKLRIPRRTNKDYRKYTLKSDYFEIIDSHEKAAILGFIFADGYNNQKEGKTRIIINKEDIDYLEKINNEIQPNKEKRITFIHPKEENESELASLTIYCKKISDDLASLGCIQNKSLTARFPNIKDEFLSSFLLGYLDGDGCISYSNSKTKTQRRNYMVNFCVSDDFGIKAKQIIEKMVGIHVGLRKKGKISALHIGGNLIVVKFLDWLYSLSPIKLNRKHEKYLEMKEYFIKNPLKPNCSHPRY